MQALAADLVVQSQGTQYVLSLSYGKDSMASIYVVKEVLGWPLHRIVTADVWATDTIPADPPPMVEFKGEADATIKKRWGIEVEHFCARDKNGEKVTYEKLFYHIPQRKTSPENAGGRYRPQQGQIDGWPSVWKPWCNGHLKIPSLQQTRNLRISDGQRGLVQEAQNQRHPSGASRCSGGIGVRATSSALFSRGPLAQGAQKNIVQYIGIAADEPERIERHASKPGIKLPLVEAGWTEAMCREWCEGNGLLSPVYNTATRGGCWFCHNQGVNQLRLLRKSYPEYWALMLKWDADSPVSFHPDGHTVHDFDKRFQMEDEGLLIPGDKRFRWEILDGEFQIRFF